MAEGLVGDRDVEVAELVVHDPAHPLRAEQGRVALHRRVQAPVVDEVARDPLDLVGRAAVHRRERHGVGDAGGDVQLADRRQVTGDDLDVRRQPGGRVGHGVEVPPDVGLPDPLEVVADAHVEHDAGALAGEAERAVEGVDEHPGAQVLVERLVDPQLLAPLDVVALVLDVDARLVDLQLVEGLDGLELDQPGAREPRRDDVLGHLGVRPGGDAPRRVELDPELASPEAVVRAGHEGGRYRHAEDGALPLELAERPVRELLHREGAEPVRHRVLSRRAQSRACRRAACSRALARTSSASTRVGRPSARTTSPSIDDAEWPDPRREGDVPGVHRVVGPGHLVAARLGHQVPAGLQPGPGGVRSAGDVHRALQDVGQPERLEDVAADPVRAQGHPVREAGRVRVPDRVVQVRHRVVEDRPAQGVVGRQVDAVGQEPVVTGQAGEPPRRIDIARRPRTRARGHRRRGPRRGRRRRAGRRRSR